MRRQTWKILASVVVAVVVSSAGAGAKAWAAGTDCQRQTMSAPPGHDLEDRSIEHLGAFCEDIPPPSTVRGAFVPDPVDGRSSAACRIDEAASFDNVHCFTNLTDLPFTPPLLFSVDFKLPEGSCNNDAKPSIVQAIEFSMSRYQGRKRWEWALQLENVTATANDGAPQWRVWRPESSSWQPIVGVAVPTDLCDGGEWHTLQMRGNISPSDRIHFASFTIDDAEHRLDALGDFEPVDVASEEPDRFAAAVQIDSNSVGGLYKAYVDHLTLVPAHQAFGLDFSPYMDGQSPDAGTQIGEDQLRERMRLVSPYTRWVRSYGCADGLQRTGAIAHELGLKAALGAWISLDTAENDRQIACLVDRVNAGEADLAIVGSEALLHGVTEGDLVRYLQGVRSATAGRVPVAASDTYGALLSHPSVMAASDVVLPNVYAFWDGIDIAHALAMLHARHALVQAAVPGKRIIVSETGWPSCGDPNAAAVPSVRNAAYYFWNLASWARATSVETLYFEAFDESWKNEPHGVGPCWGIADKLGAFKPGMQVAFATETAPCNWGECAPMPGGPGTPKLEFTRVPKYDSVDVNLDGRALHARPFDTYVAVYIKVAGGWWTKPTFEAPRTTISFDGTWSSDVVTGGFDHQATEYRAFLLPNAFDPPKVSGTSSLPSSLDENALASASTTRTPTRPVASFGFAPRRPLTNESVAFDGSLSADPDGTITAYAWDLDADSDCDDAVGMSAARAFADPGDHSVTLCVTDDTGDVDEITETVPVVSPPETTIQSGASGPTNDRTPTFTFSASAPDSTFACQVDGQVWMLCLSTFTLTPQSDEPHELCARATGHGGETDPTPACRQFTVDTEPPQTSIDVGPPDPTNDPSPTFEFSSSEPGSSFSCRVDDWPWTPCVSPHTTDVLPDGRHEFCVRATDPADNTDPSPACRQFTVDTLPPQTSIDVGPPDPTNDPTPTFEFSSDESGSSFECRVDDGLWTPCTPPFPVGPLPDGRHTFCVRATDPARNTDPSPACRQFTVDTLPPQTSIDVGPPDPTNDPTPTFEFSSSEPGSSFACRVDGGPSTPCASPHTTNSLPDGRHTHCVSATDAAGNADASSACRQLIVDTVAPQTTIVAGPPEGSTVTAGNVTFAFISDAAGAAFSCRLDSREPNAFGSCSSPLRTPQLSVGRHVFDVRATDAAGNTDASPARRAFKVQPAVCAPNSNIIVLTPRDDRRAGTARPDAIFGRDGRDLLHGLRGDDCLFGERGSDRLFGGSGGDRLSGGSDGDRLVGGSGPDRLLGGPGNDRLSGGPDNDRLSGGPGNDRIFDDAGRATVEGAAGNDRIDVRDASRSSRRISDSVRCGSGARDRVLVDPVDRVSRDCERVTRRSR